MVPTAVPAAVDVAVAGDGPGAGADAGAGGMAVARKQEGQRQTLFRRPGEREEPL